MNKTIINEKEFLLKNIEENLLTIKYISQYNSLITNSAIQEKFEKIPFTFDEKNNTIKPDIKIKKINSLGYQPLLTLLSIKINSNEKINLYHLLSYSIIDKKFYINFYVLKLLNNIFNEYYYELLLSLKNTNDLKKILIYLYKGFSFNEQNKINFTKEDDLDNIYSNIIKLFNDNKLDILELDKNYYYFNTIDLNIYKNIKKDLLSIYEKNISSIANFYYIKNNMPEYKNKIEYFNIPFIPCLDNNSNNDDLTTMQQKVLKDFKYNINNVLGVAGSGKTYLLSKYFPNIKHWNAYSIANKHSPINILYASYSDSTNKIFFEHMKKSKYNKKIDYELNFSLIDLVFYIKRNGKNELNISEDTYESISKRLSIKKENLDINKLLEIKNKLENAKNIKIENQFNILKNLNELLNKYKFMYSLKEKEILKKLIFRMKKFVDENNTFIKSLLSLFFTNKEFIFKEEELLILRKIFPYVKKQINLKNDKDIFQKYFEEIKKILINKDVFSIYKEFNEKTFSEVELDLKKLKISNSDYYYYLLFHYYTNTEENIIQKYNNVLKKIINNEELIKEDFKYFKELFPIHISNISDLNYYIPIEFNYYMSLIDEALLVPNYLTYSVLSRTSFVSVIGDVSQMTFYHLLPKTALVSEVEKLYGKYKDDFSMFLNERNNKINSFYDILSYKKTFKDNNNFNLLYDNFRYNKNIYETLFKLSDEYNSYRNNKKFEISSQVNSLVPFYWEYINNIKKPIQSNLILLESDKNKSNTYKKIFYNIKTENNYMEFNSYKKNKKISIAILTPFSIDKKIISKKIDSLKENHSSYFYDENNNFLYSDISILSVYEVQGMEFDIVIYDSFLDTNKNEYETILTNKPQILTVAISRSKNIFFLIGTKNKFYSTESDIHKNIRTVVKEKFTYID